MSKEFNIEIISPDAKVFMGKSEEVVLPCYEGQSTILKDHIPFITSTYMIAHAITLYRNSTALSYTVLHCLTL